jgi:hypothetical protein
LPLKYVKYREHESQDFAEVQHFQNLYCDQKTKMKVASAAVQGNDVFSMRLPDSSYIFTV